MWTKEKVLELRRKLGLSQGELAKMLGCRQQTVSEWEVGAYAPANAYGKLLDGISLQARVSQVTLSSMPSRTVTSPFLEGSSTTSRTLTRGPSVAPPTTGKGAAASFRGSPSVAAAAGVQIPASVPVPVPALATEVSSDFPGALQPQVRVHDFDSEPEFVDKGFDPAID